MPKVLTPEQLAILAAGGTLDVDAVDDAQPTAADVASVEQLQAAVDNLTSEVAAAAATSAELEAKLQAAAEGLAAKDAELAAAVQAKDAAQAQAQLMHGALLARTNSMCVALGLKSLDADCTVQALVEAYTDTETKFKAKFVTGGAAARTTDKPEAKDAGFSKSFLASAKNIQIVN